MNQPLRQHKQAIRAFLRTEVWTEEKLCALLAHAQDKLSMWSCCCLIGVATADHALRPRHLYEAINGKSHLSIARELPCAFAAERAFHLLGTADDDFRDLPFADDFRRRLIRPIIRAELRRRHRIREAEAVLAELVLCRCTVEIDHERLARYEREAAILTLASRGAMKRLDEYDLEALVALADDSDGLTLAEMILNPRLWAGEAASAIPAHPEAVELIAKASANNKAAS